MQTSIIWEAMDSLPSFLLEDLFVRLEIDSLTAISHSCTFWLHVVQAVKPSDHSLRFGWRRLNAATVPGLTLALILHKNWVHCFASYAPISPSPLRIGFLASQATVTTGWWESYEMLMRFWRYIQLDQPDSFPHQLNGKHTYPEQVRASKFNAESLSISNRYSHRPTF